MAAATAATTAALAACGSDDDADSAGRAATDQGGNSVVATQELDGLGAVLVDDAGQALYFTDQETDGAITCVDACLGFWTPAVATGPLPNDIEGLDTVRRDDTGDEQLTYDGAPLYTFTQDRTPGQVTGDDLTDTFGGVEFTWHAAVTDDAGAEEDDDGGDDGGGYDGGGYSY